MNRTWIAIAAIVTVLTLVVGFKGLNPHHIDPRATSTPAAAHASQAAAEVTAVLPQHGETSTAPSDPGPAQATARTIPTAGLDEHDHTDSDTWPSGKPVPSPTPAPSWLTSTQMIPAAIPSATPVQVPDALPRGANSWTAPDLSNPTAVGAAFIQRYNTLDAATDPNAWGGPARAAVFATPNYASALRSTTANTSAAWGRLRDRQGFTTVTVTRIASADQPDDTPSVAYRAYALEVITHDLDGAIAITRRSALVKLLRAGAAWQVSGDQSIE